MSAPATSSVAVPAAFEPERLERLLRYARMMARSAFCAAPVRELFGQLAQVQHALVELPNRMTIASDPTVANLLQRHGEDLDRLLYGSPWPAIEELYGVAVAHDPRLAGLEVSLPPHLDHQRHHAREALRRRGVQRIAPSPGSLPDPAETTPAAHPPLLTAQAHLDGRVARVAPGDGGWRLHDRVVRPARVQIYAAAIGLADGQAAG